MGEVDVYLDVDGVLNAVTSRDPDWGWSPRSVRRQTIAGFPICWSAELIDRLNALAACPGVHFHWLTTWEHDAPQILAGKIGLVGSQWPVIGTQERYSKELTGGWWKLTALRDVASKDRRIVWIDDDLIDSSARAWASTLRERILLVQPDVRVGLTKDMMTGIEQWIETGRIAASLHKDP